MGSVTKQIEIDAPAPAVWEVLEDVRRLPQFSPSTVEVDAPPRLERTGQHFDQTVELAGRRFTSTWTVTELEPGARLVISGSVLPGTSYTMTEQLEPDGDDASRLSLTMDYRLPFGPVGRLAARLGAERRAIEEATQVLAGVKAAAEAGAAAR
jgi:uncharacterized membrane protein